MSSSAPDRHRPSRSAWRRPPDVLSSGGPACSTESRPRPSVPRALLDGAERTWVVFTTPYCASCGPVEERLRQSDPSPGSSRSTPPVQPASPTLPGPERPDRPARRRRRHRQGPPRRCNGGRELHQAWRRVEQPAPNSRPGLEPAKTVVLRTQGGVGLAFRGDVLAARVLRHVPTGPDR